jgi:hypothetical protein
LNQSLQSWEMKNGTNVTMHTPPFPASRLSTSSGTLRGLSQRASAEECEKITGARDASRAACIVDGETWDKSTSMPRRCISATTSRPKSVSPPGTTSSVAEDAQPTLELCVSVMYRTPSAYSERSTPSEPPIEWPPSAPSSEAILPAAKAFSTSSAVSASWNRDGYCLTMRCTMSICSRTAVTAASPASLEGT